MCSLLRHSSLPVTALVGCFWISPITAGSASAQGAADGGKAAPEAADQKAGGGKRQASRPNGSKDPFKGLSDEEKERLRNALNAVWKNPEVEMARANLQEASDLYKIALREAVREADPELREPIDRILRGRIQQEYVRAGGDGRQFHPASKDIPNALRNAYKQVEERALGDAEFLRLRREANAERHAKRKTQKILKLRNRLEQIAKATAPETVPVVLEFYESRWPEPTQTMANPKPPKSPKR